MRPQNGVVLSLGVCLWAAFVGVGCTFPSVDYEDPTTTTTMAPVAPCAVPQACINAVTNCTAQARVKSDNCVNKCSGGQSSACIKCQDAAASAFSACTVGCENCSANNGCLNATDSCGTYINPP